MSFLAPRIAPGMGEGVAGVAFRFYFFSLLLVLPPIFPPPSSTTKPYGLAVVALLALSMVVFLYNFSWDKYEPRVFTLVHLFSSSFMTALLVYFTGGLQSSYGLLFFLIILFSYFYNLAEMFSITTVVTLFYLLPYIYDGPHSRHIAISAVTGLFFFLCTYILYGVTRFVLRKNSVLEDLNTKLSELYSITAVTLRNMEKDALLESLSEGLKEHLPSTYAIVLLFDDKLNLVMRIACPVRTLTWEPLIGTIYPPDRLMGIRALLETRQPKVFRLDLGETENDLRRIVSKKTRSVLIVPIRIGAENVGAMVFGEEREWERAPFNNEAIQLAIAISRQVGIGINLWWCHERLTEARHNLEISHDKMIKAERLAPLGEVTRAVEHEINNPLNVIVNWAEIYREDDDIDPEVRKKFQVIYEMAMRIQAVIRKLSEIKDAKSIEFLKGQKMTDIE